VSYEYNKVGGQKSGRYVYYLKSLSVCTLSRESVASAVITTSAAAVPRHYTTTGTLRVCKVPQYVQRHTCDGKSDLFRTRLYLPDSKFSLSLALHTDAPG
jgi:hypothetical protein